MSCGTPGYGDFVMKPDMDSCGPCTGGIGTVLRCLTLMGGRSGRVVGTPRLILRHQIERLAERGMERLPGHRIEFMVFLDTYEEARKKEYRDSTRPTYPNVDYSMLGTALVEPLCAPDPPPRRPTPAAGRELEG